MRGPGKNFRVAFDDGSETGRVLLPQGLPQRTLLLPRLGFAGLERQRLLGIAAQQLAVQELHGVAQHLGDFRPLERRQVRLLQPRELLEQRFLRDRHIGQRQLREPAPAAFAVVEAKADGGTGRPLSRAWQYHVRPPF